MATSRNMGGVVRSTIGLVLAVVLAVGFAIIAGATPIGAEPLPPESRAQSAGLLPLAPEWLTYTYDDAGLTTLAASDLPESYDLRSSGLVTGVKDQTPFEACWAFGALGSLESNALMQGGASLNDWAGYSERHLAWFAYEPLVVGTQAGEGVAPARVGGTDPAYHIAAGTSYMALTALASWEGAEDGTAVPYTDNAGTTVPGNESWLVDESRRFDSENHLTDVDFLPTPVTEQEDSYEFSQAATDAIKRSILKGGAVSASYYADRSTPGAGGSDFEYFNPDTWASCVANVEEWYFHPAPNHVITIVGWDDSYSKSNFVKEHQPAGDGAWIVKNSWGTGWWGLPDENGVGTGYFYLSYYDETAGEFMSFRGDSAADGFDYEASYQYDFLGVSAMLVEQERSPIKKSTANVFVSQGDEELGAVSAMTLSPDMTVDAEVYLLDEGAVNPTDGVLAARASRSFDFSGYHVVALDTPIDLDDEQRFSVVETITSRADDYSLLYQVYFENGPADEESAKRWGDISLLDTTVVVHAGESYLYADGDGWKDATSLDIVACRYDPSIRVRCGNALIKAFTNMRGEEPPDPDEPVNPSDPEQPVNPGESVVPEPGNTNLEVGEKTAIKESGYLAATGDITLLSVIAVAGVMAVAGITVVAFPVVRIRRR